MRSRKEAVCEGRREKWHVRGAYKGWWWVVLLLGSWLWQGTAAQVPKQLHFDNLKIRFTSHARQEIEHKMQALAASKRSLAIKVARARQYFPLIEDALRAEGVPLDFKYLVLQESALISDAVSSSQAVGFWQFKDFTAKEVGLRVDRQVDARMHIVASTQGAARYLKRNNFYFDNWMFALTAYYAGRSGAEKFVSEKYMGKRTMVISKSNHWYIKTFLAHLLIFEKELSKPVKPAESNTATYLLAYSGKEKTLRKVAHKFNLSTETLHTYNKWLRHGNPPADETLPVIVPLQGKEAKRHIAAAHRRKRNKDTPLAAAHSSTTASTQASSPAFVPISKQIDPHWLHQVRINGITALVANKHDDLNTLAIKGGVSEEKLSWYNEIEEGHRIEAGQIFYLHPKRGRAQVHYHTAAPGETLWGVAQRYGIRLRALRRKNRMDADESLQAGRLLWLRKRRPAHEEITYVDTKPTPATEPSTTPEHTPKGTPKHAAAPVSAEKKTRSTPTSSPTTHIVHAGETLYGIANRYGVTLGELLRWNNLSRDAVIRPGDALQLHNARTTTASRPSATRFHMVKPGDTLYSIARRYEVSLASLRKWNNRHTDLLKVGEKIKLSP